MPDDWRGARVGLAEDVKIILARFRREHNWQPGQIWNPYQGKYTDPDAGKTNTPGPEDGKGIGG